MSQKNILQEKTCNVCSGNRAILHFRCIEKNIVYYWERCMHCHRSRRSNMPIEEWKKAILTSDELQDITKHHRRMRCHNGGDEPENISLVPRKKHEAFHRLFGNMTTREIVKLLNDVWIDPLWEITAHKKIPHT